MNYTQFIQAAQLLQPLRSRMADIAKTATVLSLVSALVAGMFVQGLFVVPETQAALDGTETIETIAGAAEGGFATEMLLGSVDVEVGSGGDVFTASGARVYRIDSASGIATVYVGTGLATEDIGDGGPAREASIGANEIAIDSRGNLYISGSSSSRIRKVDAVTSAITTVVGTGIPGYSGDGGLAVSAEIRGASDLVFDASDNLYFSDTNSNVVRRVNVVTGVITTIAGIGTSGNTGDGGPAVNAELNDPTSLAFDSLGNLYVGMSFFLRRIDTNGIITRVAGNGSGAGTCHTGPALSRAFGAQDLAVDENDLLYVAGGGSCVRTLDASGNLTLVAGTGVSGYSGDGGPALSAQIDRADGIARDGLGGFYFSDNFRVRHVDASGKISTAAGIGQAFFSGESGPANYAVLPGTDAPAVDMQGNLYIGGGDVIFKVDADGTLMRFAGTGMSGDSGDSGPALLAELEEVRDLAVSPTGNALYLTNNDRIRKIDLTTGIIDAFAGSIVEGFSGDGGPALNAALDDPSGIGVDENGNVYIADTRNERVRVVDTSGIITTVAGGGSNPLNHGQPVPALSLAIGNNGVVDVAVDSIGNIYFADGRDHQIVLVSTSGIASIFAGHRGIGSDGDGGLAVNAELGSPNSIVIDVEDNMYVGQNRGSPSFPDTDSRIRMIDSMTGIITTVAGTGVTGFSGDGGPANQARITVSGIAFSPNGDLYIAGPGGRIRRVSSGNRVSDFTVLAKESLHLQSGTTVLTGDVGANTAEGAILDGGAEASIGSGVTMQQSGSRVMGDTVRLRNNSSVWDVYFNDLINNGTIQGNQVTPLDLPLLEMFPQAPAMPENAIVANDATLALPAGDYARLIAGARSVITFTGGEYDFTSWNVSPDAVLEFSAPTEIRISGKLDSAGGVAIGPADGSGIAPSDIVIYVNDINGDNGNIGATPKAADFGMNTVLHANVYAVNGTLHVRGGSEVIGALLGRWVDVGSNVTLELDSAF